MIRCWLRLPDGLGVEVERLLSYSSRAMIFGKQPVERMALPATAPDGAPLFWTLHAWRAVGTTSAATARVEDGSVLVLINGSTTSLPALFFIDLRGRTHTGYRARIFGMIEINQALIPARWAFAPSAYAPGGERIIDGHVLEVARGATSDAFAHSVVPLAGQVYLSSDHHIVLPVGTTPSGPYSAIGICDAASLSGRPIPGDVGSVGIRRMSTVAIQVWVNGVQVHGWLDGGIHRRIDVRVDAVTRQVWFRTPGPYSWSGPHVVPGTGSLFVIGWVNRNTPRSYLRLISSPAELGGHVDPPAGYALGWVEP